MTAKKGTDSFTTKESFISEEKHISLVDEIFNEFKLYKNYIIYIKRKDYLNYLQ